MRQRLGRQFFPGQFRQLAVHFGLDLGYERLPEGDQHHLAVGAVLGLHLAQFAGHHIQSLVPGCFAKRSVILDQRGFEAIG